VAFQSKEESKAMTKLAEQNRSDTRSLKALSMIGTLYLPATFLAVSPIPVMITGGSCFV
jgi:hypothetical protein